MTCTFCKGKGACLAHINTGMDSSKHRWANVPCPMCKGVKELNVEWVTVGRLLKKARSELRLSIWEAAKLLGITPSALSSMELGKTEPLNPAAFGLIKKTAGGA